MKHVVIPFTVKTNSLETVKSIIKKFITAIHKNEPGTLMYRSFQQSDDPSKFIHVMTFEDEEAMEIHKQSSYCREFVDKLYPLCTETPKPAMYSEIK